MRSQQGRTNLSKTAFRNRLIVILALLLLAISPFAVLGGMVVAFAIFTPVMLSLAAIGADIRGQTIDGYVIALFAGFAVLMVLFAIWKFFEANAWRKQHDLDKARASAANGITVLASPVLLYLFYQAIPGI